MDDLATRIESAGEGSRELDLAIVEWAIERRVQIFGHVPNYAAEIWLERYGPITESLDAAETLVPVGYEWLRKSPGTMTVYKVPADDKEWAMHIDAKGADPALALCAASIRAREAG